MTVTHVEPIRTRMERARRRPLCEATVEVPSLSEALGARGAAAIACHCIGLPEREGVSER